jgi:hypothetical protein
MGGAQNGSNETLDLHNLLPAAMTYIDPVRDLGEKVGRVTNQFEPGSPVYLTVVERAKMLVDQARTRDDIEQLLIFLVDGLRPHLADEAFAELVRSKSSLEQVDSAMPVDAFREGFARGTGDKLPDANEPPLPLS